MEKMIKCVNPILNGDFPDPDVIRVEDTYYMVSTTMHFMPGAVILRSFDLAQWEIVSHVYDVIEENDSYGLNQGGQAYGNGMWAPCLRYHNGKYYVSFSVNDLHKTVLFQSDSIEGPWKKSFIDGFYYDSSLLFDEDNRVYIVHGNREIHLTELKSDLSGPKENGMDRVIVRDSDDIGLGYEGAHIYKIKGKYYVFFIHWPTMRTEACFISDSLEGEFVGKDVLCDDMNYHGQGVAQGGIIDTPEGDWYGVFFQDHGAVGRIPVLIPMVWENEWPVFGENGKVPKEFMVKSTRPEHRYEPLYCNDDFTKGIGKQWEWNHNPVLSLVETNSNGLTLTTDRVVKNIMQSVNTLTTRMAYPCSYADITIDGSQMKEGDYAGLCAFQSSYGLIALTRKNGYLQLVMMERPCDSYDVSALPQEVDYAREIARIHCDSSKATLRIMADFTEQIDQANFFYQKGNDFCQLGQSKKLSFKLDHFTGCRYGLFYFSTKESGGTAVFENFLYHL